MRAVVCATGSNDLWRRALEGREYSVIELRPDDDMPADLAVVAPGTPVIMELMEHLAEKLRPLAGAMVRAGARIIVVCAGLSDGVRAFACAEGITDVLVNPSAPSIPDYLAALGNAPSGNGRFVLMDDGGPLCTQIKSLVERFGYSLELVPTEDAFFAGIESSGVVWTMCNLGSEGFDVGRFVRRCALSMKMKGIPCLPFKDSRDGFFVHEFISGLNRVARVIMSPGELLSFLVSLLFRVELARLTAKLDADTSFAERSGFLNEPFPRMYHTLGMEIFSMGNICVDERYEQMLAAAEDLRNFLLRCRGLNWLVQSPERTPTCGPGV